ncbi:helix-turn-helix transcriptional regulator [Streptomyces sp. MMBL 11-1]|uniref:helix-turn-helix transcriptional regulator n=1 Tax=Streptomyces sp. MMBL 11-1 TaxID=3026420 RepID=UPI00236174A1|nr:hypothetical protein [Streptomyces sp. MMBL 11-1]
MSQNPLLTPREAESVTLLARGLSVQEIDQELGIVTSSRLIAFAKAKAIVSTQRALVYVSLAREWIPRPPAVLPPAQLSPVEELVWAGLRLDVLDGQLPGALSQLAGTTKVQVTTTLKALVKQQQLNHCGLIRHAYAIGLLSGREGTDVPPLPSRLAPPPQALTVPWQRCPAPPQSGLTGGSARRSGPPETGDAVGTGTATEAVVSVAQAVRTGEDFDVVRVSPEVCGQLLAGLPPGERGPVVCRVESATALLFLPPAVLPDGWRARHGRLWARGATVQLPPDNRPSADGSYWAVPRRAPLWSPDRLEDLLNNLPGPLPAQPGAV